MMRHLLARGLMLICGLFLSFISMAADEVEDEKKRLTPYSFAGACESKGEWSKRALGSSLQLIEYLEGLRDDPACQGIESVVLQLQKSTDSLRDDAYAAQALAGGQAPYKLFSDIHTLREALGNQNSSFQATPGAVRKMFEATLESSERGRIPGLSEAMHRAGETGVDLLGKVLDTLPNYQRCLHQNPNQAFGIVSASMHVANAFVSKGDGFFAKVGRSLARFVRFVRESHFEQRLRQLDRAEYLGSLSCVMESVSDTYCEAQNSYELLEMAKASNAERAGASSYSLGGHAAPYKHSTHRSSATTPVSMQAASQPFEGYMLLMREGEIISDWLQDVMYSVDPRTPNDGRLKAEIQRNVNEMVIQRFKLIGIYNQEMAILRGYTNKRQQQLHVNRMLSALNQQIGTSVPGMRKRNFFHGSMQGIDIPFYLIKSQTPLVVIQPTPRNAVKVSWRDYMKNWGPNGGFISEFDNPIALAATIKSQLDKLLSMATATASDYFRQQLLVDMDNVIIRALTSQTVTVLESFERVKAYLDRVADETVQGYGEKVNLPTILDTSRKIGEIIDLFTHLRIRVKTYLKKTEHMSYEKKLRHLRKDPALRKAYGKIITKVYDNFNMLFQRDTFVRSRLRNIVRADYAFKTKNLESLPDQQRLILTVSGDALLSRLLDSYRLNPTLVRRDLDTAYLVNSQNLHTVQRAFDDQIFSLILELKLAEEGHYNVWNKSAASMRHLVLHSIAEDPKHALPHPLHELDFGRRVVANLLFNRRRYNVPNPFDLEHQGYYETRHKVLAGLRAKLCVQTLMFDHAHIFKHVCAGALLRADVTGDDLGKRPDLEVDYNRALMEKMRAKKEGTHSAFVRARDASICRYYDYKLKNKAYWMLKELQ